MRHDISALVLRELEAGTIERGAAVRLLKQLSQKTPIAIVGMGAIARDTDDYRAVWRRYRAGESFIGRASQQRGDLIRSALPAPLVGAPEQMAKGNFLDDIDTFDHDLFGYSADEARNLSPHARLALMAAFRAVEDAGLGAEGDAAHTTGVFVGNNFVRDQIFSYINMALRQGGDPEELLFGNWTSGIATRISRAFDFRGPSQVIDGACASSTIAIVNACNQLHEGSIDAAITGGLYLDMTPITTFNQPGVFATATEDAVPKLYGRDNVGGFGGEYLGFVALKTLERATADGDRIHGVVHGWSESNAGANGGFDQTSPDSAAAAVRDALKASRTDVHDLGLVFAEGFAQPIEEALETDGIAKGIASLTDRRQFAAITTASPAMGYMQSAIGVAQLQLMVQALGDEVIPPTLYFDSPTELVDLVDSPFYVPAQPQDWPPPESGERRGLLYSNAYGGFYLTLVVGPAPTAAVPSTAESADATLLMVVTGSSVEGLRTKLAADLEIVRDADPRRVAELCYSSAVRRPTQVEHRVVVVADNVAALVDGLVTALETADHDGSRSGAGWRLWSGHGRSTMTTRASPTGDLGTHEAAERFCRGEHVRFGHLFAPVQRRFAPLSPHPFQRTRAWAMPELRLDQIGEDQ